MQLSSSYVLWDVWPTDFQRAPLRAGESVLLAPANTVRPYSVHPGFPARRSVAFYYALTGDRPKGKASEAGSVGRSGLSPLLMPRGPGASAAAAEDALIVGTPPARSRRPRLTPPISARRPSVRVRRAATASKAGVTCLLCLRPTLARALCALPLSPSVT